MHIDVGDLVLVKAKKRLGIVVKRQFANSASHSLHMKHLNYPLLYYVYFDSGGAVAGPFFQDELQTMKERVLTFVSDVNFTFATAFDTFHV